MPNRKKRLIKGIESLEDQIKIHEEKLKIAIDDGNTELVDYYEREIKGLEKSKENKEEKLSP